MQMVVESPHLRDMPSGPLDKYRKQATFSWKKLVTLIDGEEAIENKHRYYNLFMNDPLFKQRTYTNLDEERKLTTLRMYKLFKERKLTQEESTGNPDSFLGRMDAELHYCPSFSIKFYLSYVMFNDAISTLMNDDYFDSATVFDNGEFSGSFILTEIAHGSNAQSVHTRATFDSESQEFILNTPNFEAAKCWAGCLGKCATHGIVWARLILPNGVDQGLHAFLVPIRDPLTGIAYPGIQVGDMGHKIGLNGIDNGFMLFNNYRCPKSCILQKTGNVTPDGQYISPNKSNENRLSTVFAPLSNGRVIVIRICLAHLTLAMTIAVRYAGARKQFGPNEDEELPIIEYQLIQCRLFPYLASTYCIKIISNYLSRFYLSNKAKTKSGKQPTFNLGPEYHAVTSAVKPLVAWTTRDAIQECREACGGHGYLKAARIGDLRDSGDANCTYEGDNNVLQQQASNWLMRLWSKRKVPGAEPMFNTPFNTVEFLLDADRILASKFKANSVGELSHPRVLLDTYKWLICYLLEILSDKQNYLKSQGKNSFTIRNDFQVFFAKTLSIAFAEHFVLSRCYNFVLEEGAKDDKINDILLTMTSLYGVWSLEKHLSYLFQGQYLTQGHSSYLFKETVISLCNKLKPEAISLADGLAPPDQILNSILGYSDGEVYEHMKDEFFNNPETFTVPKWWNMIKSTSLKL